MLASDLFAPGLLVAVHPLALSTVPTITPVVLSQLARVLDRRTVLWLAGILTVIAARPWVPSWSTTPFAVLSTTLPALLSLYFEARRQLLQSLRDRAERAEREQHLLAEQARAEERRRLAGEMHDVVTHRLSLMVLHAGALGVTSRERRTADGGRGHPARRRAGVGRTARPRRRPAQRRRSRGADAQPGGAGRPGASWSRSPGRSGWPRELAVDGDPAQVSPTVARTAYRLVQEALTNVRKHAPGASATVSLRYHRGRPGRLGGQHGGGAPARPGAGGQRFRVRPGGAAPARRAGRRTVRRGPGTRRRVPGRCDTARLRSDGGRHAQ